MITETDSALKSLFFRSKREGEGEGDTAERQRDVRLRKQRKEGKM
jgi:hypothetical protein